MIVMVTMMMVHGDDVDNAYDDDDNDCDGDNDDDCESRQWR